ncbi:MAG: PH domain-containing protein [Acidimicrobiales bacterium]
MSDFSNPVVDVRGLPRLAETDFVGLHPNLLRVSLIGRAIFAVIVILVAGIAASQIDPSWIPIAVGAGVLALVCLSAALRSLELRHIAYQVREHDISFRHGVISRRVETLPFIRVQHARVNRGPIERSFGLATLQVNSAGPDLTIPGLSADDAARMKDLIVERAGALVEEP